MDMQTLNMAKAYTRKKISEASISGGGTATTDASLLTSGTLNDARLSANVTKQGNVFNGANQLIKADSTGKIPVANMPIGLVNIVSVANETARLALSTSTVLTVAFQADTMNKWSLNANLNPSVSANWINDGSYATTVPPTRKINTKTLANDITLGIGDIITLNNNIDNYLGGDGGLHQLPSGIATNDKTTSGYFDIGTMRMQWGKVPSGASSITVNLPAPFANNTYNVTANCNDNTAQPVVCITIRSNTRTTSSFVAWRVYANTGGGVGGASEGFEWFAIGLKP